MICVPAVAGFVEIAFTSVNMVDHSTKKCEQIQEMKTVTDLSHDELSCIFIIVAQSGAKELVRVMTVCRLFSEVGKLGNVLRAVNFNGIEVSEGNYKNHQKMNGLISLAADAGHLAAQYMFSKVIIMICSKLSRPMSKKSNWLDAVLERWICVPGIKLHLHRGDQTFMSQLNSKPSCNSKGLYHYRFVKIFLSRCSPSEFKAMTWHLSRYKAYCQKESDESRRSLREMWEVCDQLERCICWEWTAVLGGAHGPVYTTMCKHYRSTQKLLDELEELRSQALHDLDDIFIVKQ